MVHDRRVDGETYTFGNQGALFMLAMTWFDHETDSIWSQPWGMSIAGDLEGTRLTLIPATIVPWDAWLADHPDTLVLDAQEGRFVPTRQGFTSDFVIGIALGEHAKAYPFSLASDEGAVNDRIGPYAVVVVADAETKSVYSFLRRAADQELEFTLSGGVLVDNQTGSKWDLAKGIAIEGPLRGEVLQRVPYITAYDWAWGDFYPHTEFYDAG